MSKYITLIEAKDHLRVDFTDDDIYIQLLVDMVEEAVALEIGETLADIEDDNEMIPLRLKQGMLLLIGHFYTHREPVIVGVNATKIPLGFEFLIHPYKNYTIG